MRRWVVFAPGLWQLDPDPAFDAPAWCAALARAARRSTGVAGAVRTAFRLFTDADYGRDGPPAAAVRAAGAGPAPGHWICAEFVHWLADQHRLRLCAPLEPPLGGDERAALESVCAPLWARLGVVERRAYEAGWLLRLEGPAPVAQPPPDEWRESDFPERLPQDPAERAWLAQWNELQMALHAHAVNEARRARGEMSANGIWLWGAGAAPAGPWRRWDRVVSADPCLQALARCTGAQCSNTARVADLAAARPGAVLVHWDVRARGADSLAALRDDWIDPLLAALRAGRIDVLELWTDRGDRFVMRRGDRWRFWRPRPASWAQWCARMVERDAAL